MNIELITSPIIGGAIGLLTNSIAIKMIFKPYNEIYIGKIKLPFTPGLIPKERQRIAKAIGQVVGNNLLDVDTLRGALCSESIHDLFLERFNDIFWQYMKSDMTVRDYANKIKVDTEIDEFEVNLSKEAAKYVTDELINRKVSEQLIDAAMELVMERLNPLLMTMAGGAIAAAKEPLANKVDEMIKENCPSIVSEYIDMKYKDAMELPAKNVIEKVDEKFPYLGEIIWNAYVNILSEKANGFFEVLNIEQIIEDKINEIDIEEFERLLLQICKKELNAVVMLGGLLGMVMGCINLIF